MPEYGLAVRRPPAHRLRRIPVPAFWRLNSEASGASISWIDAFLWLSAQSGLFKTNLSELFLFSFLIQKRYAP